MADEKTVKVDLKRSYRKHGTIYGPGTDVEVPESLARGLGLGAATKATASKSEKKKKSK